ncbi:MAG: hypothetical protein GC150_06100 [Rhizobiales bacterium]|nr:hypothetical protein [Hyphomicrobiales bacterium]
MKNADFQARGRVIWGVSVLLAGAALNVLVVYVSRSLEYEWLRYFLGEAGPLEIMQSCLLLAIVVIYLRAATRARGPVGSSSAVLTMLSLAFLFRELDLGKAIGIPDWLKAATESPYHDIGFIGAMLLVLAMTVYHRQHWWAWVRLTAAPRSLPLILAGAFLFAGMIIDSRIATDNAGRLWEELLECNGYLLLLLAAVIQLELAVCSD